MFLILQIWQLRLREINLSKVILSVVFWLQRMLFYINAGIFSPSDENSGDTVATYSTSLMSLRIQVLSIILLCLHLFSVLAFLLYA